MKKPLLVPLVCAALSAVLLVYGFFVPDQPENIGTAQLSVILPDWRGTDTLQFKQGIQAAAETFGVSVQMHTAEANLPVAGQMLRWIEQWEISPGVAGLILPACDSETAARALDAARRKNAALVAVGWALDGAACVRDDPRAEGAALAEAARALRADGAPYAVFTGGAESLERLEGVKEVLGAPAFLFGDAQPDAFEALLRPLPDGCDVFALSAELTDALAGLGGGRVRVWGIDPGEARVSMLENGGAAGLLMRMPFAQGYLAVRAAVERTAGEVRAPVRVVTRETAYLSENVKLMFPLLQ